VLFEWPSQLRRAERGGETAAGDLTITAAVETKCWLRRFSSHVGTAQVRRHQVYARCTLISTKHLILIMISHLISSSDIVGFSFYEFYCVGRHNFAYTELSYLRAALLWNVIVTQEANKFLFSSAMSVLTL
jgi:hypothetical protein